MPLATLGIVFTNSAHHLYVTGPGLDNSGLFSSLIYQRGLWFYAHVLYVYLLTVVGVVLLVRHAIGAPPLYRAQGFIAVAAVMLPLAASIFSNSLFNPAPGLSYAPLAFFATILILAFNVFRFRLLEASPLAREAIMDSMSNAVLVDADSVIVDANPAARRQFESGGGLVGAPVTTLLPHWQQWLAQHAADASTLFEWQYGAPAGRGSGLGVAFCKLAIEAHQGKIWFESEAGSGTTFYFTLPEFRQSDAQSMAE